MKEKLLEIKTFLDRGEEEKAQQMLRSLETVPVRDPAFHLELVELCEQWGVIEKIAGELHLALRDLPEDRTIIRKLALFYQDSGNLEKSEKYFRKLLEPSNMDSYRELWNILEEKGDIPSLQSLSLKIKELFPDSDLAGLKIDIQKPEEESPEEEADEQMIKESQLVRFVSLFSGREGVYARQWVSPTGETGYTPVKEPFNYKVAQNHILGNYTVGVYQLRVDNTVNFIAFDIDITKRLLNRIILDKSLWKSAIKDAHSVACNIIDLLSSHEIPAYLESSGYKGRHCWIFLERPISAKIARAFDAPFDVILPEEGETFETSSNVVQPDIIVVCDKEKITRRGCCGAPDLVVEILSPSSTKRDIKDKRRLYQRYGIKEYWIVDPVNKRVDIYKLNEDGKYGFPDVYAEDDKIKVGIFNDELEIDLTVIFAE